MLLYEICAPDGKPEKLLEAAWKYSYQYGYRSWYLPSSNTFVNVGSFGSHVREVATKPELFGLTADQITNQSPKDRDPDIMNLMCANGWIRIAGKDRNNPNKFMIFEGADLVQLLRLMKFFYNDQKAELEAVAIKVRSLEGNAGTEYKFDGEQIKDAVNKKILPAPFKIDRDESIAA